MSHRSLYQNKIIKTRYKQRSKTYFTKINCQVTQIDVDVDEYLSVDHKYFIQITVFSIIFALVEILSYERMNKIMTPTLKYYSNTY